MFEYGFDLLARDDRKPVQEIVAARFFFQILNVRLNSLPSAPEHPRTTDFTRHALYGRARRPIQHGFEANVKSDKGQARSGVEGHLTLRSTASPPGCGYA